MGVGLYQGVTALAAKQVKTLTVRGDVRHIDTEVIQARLTPRITDGFMAADLGDLRDELESLPWVYKVNTRRRWPAEIEVVLVEQRPLARWSDTGYLNHQGTILCCHAGRSVCASSSTQWPRRRRGDFDTALPNADIAA
jgi:cell division protein FtsQ